MLQSLSQFILPALLILAAMTDVMSLRIPNWLTILTAALFFPMAWATAMPMHDFLMHLAVGVGLFFAGFLLFQFRVFGGGDAKLMAAAGLWFGTANTVPFLFMTALAGGCLAFVVGLWSIIALSLELRGEGVSFAQFGKRFAQFKPDVPFGFAFALGGILAFKDTWWVNSVV